MWKENNVSGTKPTYQSLLTGLSGLLGPVHAKSEGKPDDAITIEPDILASIVTVLGAVEDERKKTPGGVLHSPFVDLAIRSASHFFVERSVRSFCEKVLDEVIAEVGAGSGAFLLFQTSETEARVMAARNDRAESVEHDPRISRTTLREIASGNDSVLVHDARVDELLANEESAQQLELRSVLAIPLRFKDFLAGAIYLENQRASGAFGEQDLELLRALGRLIAVFLNVSLRLDKEIETRKRLYRELKGKNYFHGLVGSSPRMPRGHRTRRAGRADAGDSAHRGREWNGQGARRARRAQSERSRGQTARGRELRRSS